MLAVSDTPIAPGAAIRCCQQAAALWTAAVSFACVGVQVCAAQAPPGPSLVEVDLKLSSATRLLVVSPHPDDETLAAAGLIQRVRSLGGSVRVLFMTSGDGFPEGVETLDRVTHPSVVDYRNYGRLREREALAASDALRVGHERVTFLGFPDGGLCLLASKYMAAGVRALRSPYTRRVAPPRTEAMVRGVVYRGFDVRKELERVLADFRPSLVVLPHPEDEHPDHCASSIFVREALAELALAATPLAPRVLYYLVHHGDWPLGASTGTGSRLDPPSAFPPREAQWQTVALTPGESSDKKRALLAYTSQMMVIGRFMMAFGRDNELFSVGEPASQPECWCDAEHVATDTPPRQRRKAPPPLRATPHERLH
jgi:LmbE family N-acetylglucosaminyl deacetylase